MACLGHYFMIFLSFISAAYGLQCYRCQSNQPGCGKEVNIRIQHWWSCPDTGEGGGENFCVKVIKRRGSDEEYIRECLMTLRHNTGVRESLPTIQRHGYCEPGRNNDPWNPYDWDTQYCFCNDWNGCNTAANLKHSSALLSAVFGLFIAFFVKWTL